MVITSILKNWLGKDGGVRADPVVAIGKQRHEIIIYMPEYHPYQS